MATDTHGWRSLKRLKRQSFIELAGSQADFGFPESSPLFDTVAEAAAALTYYP
jgi:hypothetical protein